VLVLVSETAVLLRGGVARLPPTVVMAANQNLVPAVLHNPTQGLYSQLTRQFGGNFNHLDFAQAEFWYVHVL
jgi:hypothetical protein